MKKIFTVLLTGMIALSLSACGTGQTEEPSQPDAANSTQTTASEAPASSSEEPQPEAEAETQEPVSEQQTESPEETEESEQSASSNMLVAYFSYGENADLPEGVDASSTASIQVWNDQTTGNTGIVAAMIAQATGADVFSIQTEEPYPDTYDATLDQGQAELREDARPALATHIENLDSYDVIFIGYPNWWGDMPMALYSFFDEVDLSGKTIVPFVTSGGSGFSNTIGAIESMETDATVLEGLSISGSSAAQAQEEVEQWLSQLGYMQ